MPCPVRVRRNPFREQITVTGSSVSVSTGAAAARSAASIIVRRASPKRSPSAVTSFTASLRRAASLARSFASSPCSPFSSLISRSIRMPSSLASWRSRISRMSSAWRSDERELLHQRGLRLVGPADHLDHLVDVQERDEAPVEDVKAVQDLGLPVPQAPLAAPRAGRRPTRGSSARVRPAGDAPRGRSPPGSSARSIPARCARAEDS